MGCEAGRYNETSTRWGIFVVTASLECPTKAKEVSSHEVRLTPLDTRFTRGTFSPWGKTDMLVRGKLIF